MKTNSDGGVLGLVDRGKGLAHPMGYLSVSLCLGNNFGTW